MKSDTHLPIPDRLNIGLALLAASAALGLLWYVSHVESLWFALLGAILFSYANNTLFSLLHESVHGTFHSSDRVNTLFGRWLAAFFPTSFTLQRCFHLGHHRRNRSEAERFDYIAPGESATLKYIQWYGILTGVYWLMPPLACIVYLIAPGFYASRFFHGKESEPEWSHQTGANVWADDAESTPRRVVRSEILFAILWQVSTFWALGLHWSGWLLCYAAFAVNWSSLQYADHAWSPLDAVRGAWNLRVNRITRWIFLNYHHHLAHHENPKVSWIHLPRFVNWNEPRPSFSGIYWSMWRGPRPLPEPEPQEEKAHA